MNFMVNAGEMAKTNETTGQHPVDKRTETLKKLGIPESVINNGDEAVKKYAKEHNINLPNPPKKNVPVGCKSGNTKPSTHERDRELIKLGIPANVIAQGDKAIEKYAQEHNIKLPEKRSK